MESYPHVVFYGPAGCGKSRAAAAYGARFARIVTIDAAFENGVDTFRDVIRQLTRQKTTRRGGGSGLPPLTLIVLENADLLTVPCQMALRRLMEKQSHLCRFAFCVWGVPDLLPAVQSRCICIFPTARSLADSLGIMAAPPPPPEAPRSPSKTAPA